MDRERARVVLVGVLCVLAVVAAAATLSSPEQTQAPSGGGSITDDGSADTQGKQGDSAANPMGSPGELDLNIGACLPWLYSIEFWFAVLVVASAMWAVASYRQDKVAATAYVTALAVPFAFAWLLLSKCGTDENSPTAIIPSDVVATPKGGDATFGILGESSAFSTPVWLILLVAIAGFGAVAVALVRDADDADDPEEPMPEAADAPEYEDVAGLGEAAGRAADRIERSTAVDNEIYRAWVEMTEHLDVDHPDASTPGEFETAAVEAGVDSETVAELTGLFERVRYGDEIPTTETESRAVDALRSIETSYSDLDDFWTEE